MCVCVWMLLYDICISIVSYNYVSLIMILSNHGLTKLCFFKIVNHVLNYELDLLVIIQLLQVDVNHLRRKI